jgi:hypothetical protein
VTDDTTGERQTLRGVTAHIVETSEREGVSPAAVYDQLDAAALAELAQDVVERQRQEAALRALSAHVQWWVERELTGATS